MDFIIGLLRKLRQHDSILVVVDRLSEVARFIPIKNTYSASEVAQVFIREILRMHGFPKRIVSTGMQRSLPSFGRIYLYAWVQSWPSVHVIIRR